MARKTTRGLLRPVWERGDALASFLEAVNRHAPGVLRDLRDRVAPVCDLRYADDSLYYEWAVGCDVEKAAVQGFFGPVWEWATRHHLVVPRDELVRLKARDPGDPLEADVVFHRTFLDTVGDTLDLWGRPGPRHLTWAPVIRIYSRWGIADILPNLYCYEGYGERLAEADRPPHFITSHDDLKVYEIAFRTPRWNPVRETPAEYADRVTGEFRGHLDRLLEADAAALRGPEMVEPVDLDPVHLRWLVRYQVLGESFTAIATDEAVTKQAIHRAVETTAERVFGRCWRAWLRPTRRGRPRGR